MTRNKKSQVKFFIKSLTLDTEILYRQIKERYNAKKVREYIPVFREAIDNLSFLVGREGNEQRPK